MHVSLHAYRRCKKYGFIPRTADRAKAKNLIKKSIKQKTVGVYTNKKTGAKVFITDKMTCVMQNGTIVTVYPSQQGKEANELRQNGLQTQGRNMQEMHGVFSVQAEAKEKIRQTC